MVDVVLVDVVVEGSTPSDVMTTDGASVAEVARNAHPVGNGEGVDEP